MEYGYSKKVSLSFDDAISRVEEELQVRGFGVLADIDVKATLKKKLDQDVNNYRILGACNPQYAHQALQEEKELGLLLPCNVIVYTDDEGTTRIASVNANAMLSVTGNEALTPIADTVSDLLKEAIEAVE